jgi:hypothetical protein
MRKLSVQIGAALSFPNTPKSLQTLRKLVAYDLRTLSQNSGAVTKQETIRHKTAPQSATVLGSRKVKSTACKELAVLAQG